MKRKRITEFDVSHVFKKFEIDFYEMCDSVPKKYRYDLVQQSKDALGFAKRMITKSLRLLPIDDDVIQYKKKLMNEAYSELGLVEFNLGELYDMRAINDDKKSYFDDRLCELYVNLERLINPKSKKAKGSDAGGHVASSRESDMIRTPNYGTEGVSDA